MISMAAEAAQRARWDEMHPAVTYTPERFRELRADVTARNARHLAGEPFDNVWTRAAIQENLELRDWPQRAWPRPDPGPAPHSVAIVGKGSGRILAPWGEPGWELWGLNDPEDRYGVAPIEAHTRWVQLHGPEYCARHYPEGVVAMDRYWREPRGVSLYMERTHAEYPDSRPFPVAEIEALTPRGSYHASTFDWLVAWATLEGFQRIVLYGLDFRSFPVTNGEPLSARPCLEYWAGVAEGRGATVEICPGEGGDLFQIVHMAIQRSGLRYGLDEEPGLELSLGGDWRDLR